MNQIMRLIYSPPATGALNMATDQAIMEAVGEKRVPSTLRFYSWQPACLSLGYTQRLEDVDERRVLCRGWHIVRRPTGGRAILHTDEVTYSISFPQNHELVAGDIVTSYRRLSAALQYGLEKLGLQSDVAPYIKHHKEDLSAVCFETPSAYEITVNNKKLIGSAQVRRQSAVLQHGSIPLEGNIARICDALHYKDDLARAAAKKAVRQRATTIAEALGKRLSFDEVTEAMAEAFSETFDLNLESGTLSPQELLRIEQLRHETYTNDAWTQKR